MIDAWLRPIAIGGGVVVLLILNAREFAGKRRTLASEHRAIANADILVRLAWRQAAQALTIEQLLHMIHTMLAAILLSQLWR